MSLSLCVGDYWITMTLYSTKESMAFAMENCTCGHMFLTQPVNYKHYGLITINRVGTSGNFGIGMALMDVFPAGIMATDDKEKIAIGYNANFALFDMVNNDLVFDFNFDDSIFYFAKQYKSIIVVITEITIAFLSFQGQIVKSIPLDDIVQTFEFIGHHLKYKTQNGVDVTVDLEPYCYSN